MSVFLYEPNYDFERFFDHPLFRGVPGAHPAPRQHEEVGNGAVRSFKPKMDLHENTDRNTVTATFELPGFKKEDISVDLQNGRLTISAENKISTEHEEDGYAVRERRFGKFSRTLQLPQGVKDEEIKAVMENGILTVTFPKSAPEMAPKRVAIL